MQYPRVAGGHEGCKYTRMGRTGDDGAWRGRSQEIRDISKYFFRISVYVAERGARSREVVRRAARLLPAGRERGVSTLSTTRPAVRSIRAYQYYECIKLGCIQRARGGGVSRTETRPTGNTPADVDARTGASLVVK